MHAPEKPAPVDKLELVLGDLKRVAKEAGVEVRERALVPSTGPAGATRGGICRLSGALVLFIDPSTPLVDQIGCIAHGLSSLDLGAIELSPVLRATLGAHRGSPTPKVARNPRPLARTKGGSRKSVKRKHRDS